MFLTQNAFKYPIEVKLYGDASAWSLVELVVTKLFFVVTFLQPKNEVGQVLGLERTFFTDDFRKVEALMTADALKLFSIDLVVSGTEGWAMERVRQVWTGDSGDDVDINVYVTESGKKFSDLDAFAPGGDVGLKQIKFEL
jgi:hypothetical protein